MERPLTERELNELLGINQATPAPSGWFIDPSLAELFKREGQQFAQEAASQASVHRLRTQFEQGTPTTPKRPPITATWNIPQEKDKEKGQPRIPATLQDENDPPTGEFPDPPLGDLEIPDEPPDEPDLPPPPKGEQEDWPDFDCAQDEQEQIVRAITDGVWVPLCSKGVSSGGSIKWSDFT